MHHMHAYTPYLSVYISPKQDQFALLQRSSQRDGVSIFARGRATTQQSLTEAGPSERWRIVEVNILLFGSYACSDIKCSPVFPCSYE